MSLASARGSGFELSDGVGLNAGLPEALGGKPLARRMGFVDGGASVDIGLTGGSAADREAFSLRAATAGCGTAGWLIAARGFLADVIALGCCWGDDCASLGVPSLVAADTDILLDPFALVDGGSVTFDACVSAILVGAVFAE